MDTERRLVTLPDGRDIDLLLAGPAGAAACARATSASRTSRKIAYIARSSLFIVLILAGIAF